MKTKTIPAIAAALITLCTGAVHAAAPPIVKAQTLTSTLIYPNGKPAIDATLIIDLIDNTTHAVTILNFKPNAAGDVTYTIPSFELIAKRRIVFAESPTGIGFRGILIGGKNSTFTLEPFTSIRIQLVDSSGSPVPNVKVCPTYFRTDTSSAVWSHDLLGHWNQTTDSSGHATLTNLPQGFRIVIDADDDRFAPQDPMAPIQLATDPTTPDLTLHLTPASSISGTVVFGPTKQPVAGITVRAYAQRPSTMGGLTITDKNGQYTVNRLGPGVYNLAAQDYAGRYNDWVGQAQTTSVSSGEHSSNVTLNLIHGGLITGTITDKVTGKPLSHVAITLSYANGQSNYNSLIANETAADGIYSIRCEPGKVTLLPFIPNTYTDASIQQTVDIAEGETKTVDFHIDAPAIPVPVHGVVLDQNDKPIAGADIFAISPGSSMQTTKSDAAGRFTLDSPGLAPKNFVLARSGDLSTASQVVYNGESQITLHLVPGAECALSGEVQDQNGQPLPNVSVTLLTQTAKFGIVTDQTTSDTNGHYTFPHAFGNATYSVMCKPKGYTQADANNIDVTTGQSVTFLPLMAKITNSFIGGTVLDTRGNPVEGANITDNSGAQSDAVTDKAGHFNIEGVPLGINYVWIQVNRGIPVGFTVNDGRSDNILTMPSSVNGIVLDPDGKPAAGAQIIASDQNPNDEPIVTDSTGHFTIAAPGLKRQDEIRAKSGPLNTPTPYVYNGENPVTLQLAANNTCTITGRLKDPNGSPVAGASVSLQLWSTNDAQITDTIKTDTNGQYAFPNSFANAKYTISITAQGYGSTFSDPVHTEANPTVQMPTITMNPADSFVGGTVVDSKGNPVAGITVTDSEVQTVHATTDKSGHFTLNGVPRNKTDIYYAAPNGQFTDQQVTSGRGDNIVYLPKM